MFGKQYANRNSKNLNRRTNGMVLLAHSTERSKQENIEVSKAVDELYRRMFRIERALNIKH